MKFLPLALAACLCGPVLAEGPRVRVQWQGGELRLLSSGPLTTRARMENGRLVVDVKGAGDMAGVLPLNVRSSRVAEDTLRIECPAPPAMQARSRRSVDGRALRVSLQPTPPTPNRVTVSHDFVDADLVYVIKVLAKDLDMNVYIGPGVEGEVNCSLRQVPPEPALALLLQGYNYNKARNGSGGITIVVAPPSRLGSIPNDQFLNYAPTVCPPYPGDPIRQEILLNKARAASVMWELAGRYHDVDFRMHPHLNGFYICGPREDVRKIKAEISTLDRPPEPIVRP